MSEIMPHYEQLAVKLSKPYLGKSRDTYYLGNGFLLIVASNRISTNNLVHLSLVPQKGEVLTALTIFWLTEVLSDLPHHLVAYGNKIFDYLPGSHSDYPADLSLRAIIVKRLEVDPREFIFRAYLTGSLWTDYYSKEIENPYGVKLASGLPKMYRFNPPIFTPTEKSETDDPVNSRETIREYTTSYSLAQEAFLRTREYANQLGVEIIDSKFEIGVDASGKRYIADEVATPDSSRFALLNQIVEGEDPPWLDKQIARDAAKLVWGEGGLKVPLKFSPLQVNDLRNAYSDLFKLLVGMKLKEFQRERLGYTSL